MRAGRWPFLLGGAVMLAGCVGHDPPPLEPVYVPLPPGITGRGSATPDTGTPPPRPAPGRTWTAEGRLRDVELRASRLRADAGLLLAALGPDAGALSADARIELDTLRQTLREVDDGLARVRAAGGAPTESDLQNLEIAVARGEQVRATLAAAVADLRAAPPGSP